MFYRLDKSSEKPQMRVEGGGGGGGSPLPGTAGG